MALHAYRHHLVLPTRPKTHVSMETIKCELCGKTLTAADNHYYDDGGYYVCDDCWESKFVDCERCDAHILIDDAYSGYDGYLCECCHDDLFG